MGVKLAAASGGSVELVPTNTASNYTVTFPASTGTVLTTTSPKAGNVIQVVQASKTDTFSTTAGSGNPATITGLSASITPTSASSKIMVHVNFGQISASADSTWGIFMYRNGTKINAGDAAGSRALGTIAGGIPSTGATWRGNPGSIMYLDSPATTSAVSYTFAIGGNAVTATIYLNQDGRDNNVANDSTRTPTNIILMEIAA